MMMMSEEAGRATGGAPNPCESIEADTQISGTSF